jgi:hypothetical protein
VTDVTRVVFARAVWQVIVDFITIGKPPTSRCRRGEHRNFVESTRSTVGIGILASRDSGTLIETTHRAPVEDNCLLFRLIQNRVCQSRVSSGVNAP